MMEQNDADLLQTFVREGSGEAFASLARRHAGLLYHTALRVTGSPDLAEEAAQNALAILARKAPLQAAAPSLAPWLHRTVRFEAAKLRRRERRYQCRMNRLIDAAPAAETPEIQAVRSRIAPFLDEALNQLPAPDRQVMMLKYFEGWNCQEMARRMGGEPAAWRQKVSRALQRLRKLLARRGVAVPLVALAGALNPLFTTSAPAAVTATLSTAPLAASGSLTWKSLTLHTLHMMNAKQIIPAALLIVAAAVPLSLQSAAVDRARTRVADLESTVRSLRPAVPGLHAAGPLSALRPARASGGPAGNRPGDSAWTKIDLADLARALAAGPDANMTKLVQYQLLVHQMAAADLRALLLSSEAADLPPEHRLALYERLLPALASKDPAAAVTTGVRLVQNVAGSEAVKLWMNPLPNCLRDWASKDPAAALAWYQAQIAEGAFQTKSLSSGDLPGWMASGLFTGLMQGGEKKDALNLFSTLPDEARIIALQRYGGGNFSAQDRETLLELSATIADPAQRSASLTNAVMAMGKGDLGAAGDYVSRAGLPDAEARKLLVAAAVATVKDPGFDTAGRLEWLRQQTAPDQRDKALGYFLGSAARRDPDSIRGQVDAEIAAGATDAFTGAYIRNAAKNSGGMDAAFSYFSRLTDPAERSRTLRELYDRNPEAVRAAAPGAGVTAAELDAAVRPE